jgi:L-seryl-tRNA(Ser) seleniumtransferase
MGHRISAPAEGLEPPTTGLRTPRLYPLSYAGSTRLQVRMSLANFTIGPIIAEHRLIPHNGRLRRQFVRCGAVFSSLVYSPKLKTGSGAARLARRVRDAEVGGSNPLSPTSRHSNYAVPFLLPVRLFNTTCYDSVARIGSRRGVVFMARDSNVKHALRSLPSVDVIINSIPVRNMAVQIDQAILVSLARDAVASVRASILEDHQVDDPERAAVSNLVERLEQISQPRLHEVINATGVIIHTNLGRAPVSQFAAEAMSLVASRYTPLELEIGSGKRGGRMSEISRMLELLTGAEASLVVNNNAAAVMLTLSALCSGREVILSRSQAVEIGGGFRIPDVLAQSGATLVEVGTTNRTYARDYESAITDQTAALLTVHWSNFKIIGFTKQPTHEELAELANSRSLPLIEDLGSGSLLETTPYGLSHEPTVMESIASGVDVVCFSGDKLLGGPQAGIISGRKDLVDQITTHPLARAVRADKTALAGIAETLRHYVRGEALEHVPVWQMISSDREYLRLRCEDWRSQIGHRAIVSVVETTSAIGGGSLPGESLSSWGLAIEAENPDRLARALRLGEPSIMSHIEDDRLILDARTVLPGQERGLIEGVRAALGAE